MQRTELYKWFTAFYLISRVDSGVSATVLSQAIRVTYKTAWLILHKIRHAMTLANQQTLLSGIVQVNASAYGKPHNPTIQLHKQERPLLVGAAMDDYGQPACFRIKLVPHSHMYQRVISAVGSKAFMEQYIEPCTSNVEIVTGRFSPKRFKTLLAFVNDASKWINATFHGLGRKHLQAYLDEFTYRRNLTIREEPILFHLLRQCISSSSVIREFSRNSYRHVIGNHVE
ncbi:transposase [Paenibacillus allorhizosphaerae]|uniref:transposase n=1 Tax=Paenibacillus allorhizosphaerae TaxID=2849866 RepID=UPI001E428501|nr:transposase [Paenibacillus allorhizosphaerae]